MASYTIPFDVISKKFDSQYPIQLADRQVTHQEYTATVNRCSEILGEAAKQTEQGKGIYILLVFILTFMFTIVPVGIGLGVGIPLRIPYLTAILIVPSFIIYFVSIFGFIRYKRNRMLKILTQAELTLTQFLEQENYTKYYPKGIQILCRSETDLVVVSTGKSTGVAPIKRFSLVINMANGPIQVPQTIPYQAAPTMYYQQPMAPPYQQQPHHVAPLVYQQQPVVYQSTEHQPLYQKQ